MSTRGGKGSFSHPNTEKWQCFCCWEGRGLAWGGRVGQSVRIKAILNLRAVSSLSLSF